MLIFDDFLNLSHSQVHITEQKVPNPTEADKCRFGSSHQDSEVVSLFVCLFVCLSALFVCQFVCLFVFESVCWFLSLFAGR